MTVTGDSQNREPFERLIAALAPWLGQAVIVGGQAHRLYRLHPYAQELGYPPLATLDTDVALPTRLPAEIGDIRARLLSHGFSEELLGEDHPPATHYHLGDDASGFYAEFLTPLYGSETDRKKKRKSTAEISGVVSQRLRYVELLIDHPWSVDFAGGGPGVKIRVANPASFLAQKVLIRGKREREDRAKDILYLHDTIEVFGARLGELRELWRKVVMPNLSPRAANTVSKASTAVFGGLSDDIRRAAAVAASRGLSPEALRQACRYGFDEIFG